MKPPVGMTDAVVKRVSRAIYSILSIPLHRYAEPARSRNRKATLELFNCNVALAECEGFGPSWTFAADN